jgi:hypothetical protein
MSGTRSQRRRPRRPDGARHTREPAGIARRANRETGDIRDDPHDEAGCDGSHGSGDGQARGSAEDAFGRQANKGILADKVAEELNVPRRTAARVLDAVLDAVSDLLRGRGKVAVKGFGTFERASARAAPTSTR